MTTILAVETDGDVFFGFDSMVTGNDEKSELDQPKVFASNGAVYGVAGNLLYLNELRYAELPKPPAVAAETDRWVTLELCSAIREVIAQAAPRGADDGFESNVLVAANGRVYEIADDIGWSRNRAGAYGIGTGFKFGLGALSAGADMYSAIRVAAKHDTYTGFKLTVASASELLRDAPG